MNHFYKDKVDDKTKPDEKTTTTSGDIDDLIFTDEDWEASSR